MIKQEIIKFLLEKPGYLKEGSTRLSRKLGITKEEALEATREARSILNLKSNKNLEVKSMWQTAGGEWRFSYKGTVGNSVEEITDLKEELVSELKSLSKKSRILYKAIKDGEEKVALEISVPDFHFGKIDGRTLEQQAEEFIASVITLAGKAKGYNVNKIILPIGNDIFNSEGMRKTTTKGTPQNDNEDWRNIYRIGWTSVVSAIKELSEIAPVDILVIPGNHDYEVCFHLGETLSAFFHSDQNVRVYNPGEQRYYYRYGKNLLGYTHGNNEKVADLPLIMATERPVDFSECPFRSWRLGHIHKHVKDEFRGVEVEFLPSLCGHDEWHRQQGYQHERKAIATIWNFKGGKDGTLILNK